MKAFRLTCFVLVLAAALSFPLQSRADLIVGTASGGSITDTSGSSDGATVVVAGPSYSFLDADTGGTLFEASTDFGLNKARAYSVSGMPGSSAYGASYWGDEITFTGGVGNLDFGIEYGFSVNMSDATETVSIISSPSLLDIQFFGAGEGTSSVRWRNYLFVPLDLNSIDFAVGSPGGGLLDMLQVDGVGGPLSPTDVATKGTGYTIGVSSSWQYGVPLGLGMLLETNASDGGMLTPLAAVTCFTS